MAAKRVKMDANASTRDASDPMREMKESCVRLRGELDAEKKTVRQLRRDKTYEVQQAREQEQRRATVALNNLRTKLHQEKIHELSSQKDALTRRFDGDLQRALRQKDSNIQRLERSLKKTQQQVAMVTQPRGLSTGARDAFESERTKLLDEVKQLRTAKKSADENASRSQDAERKMAQEMQLLHDRHKVEMLKLSKDADLEIKKLLEEIKSKNRQLFRLDVEPPGSKQSPGPPLMHSSVQTDDLELAEVMMSPQTADDDDSSLSLSSEQDSAICMVDSTDGLLFDRDTKSEPAPCHCHEEHHLVTAEQNRELTERNQKLVSMAKELDAQLRRVHEEKAHMQCLYGNVQRECEDLMEQLHAHQEEALQLHQAHEQLAEMETHQHEMSLNMTALQLACSEKERRIELLVHRLKKRRPSKSKPKTVRFLLPAKPYTWPAQDQEEERVSTPRKTCIRQTDADDGDIEDEGEVSVDESDEACSTPRATSPTSDMSLDDVSSIASDSVFDETGQVECHASNLEKKYQQLSLDHLRLERDFALLQASQSCDWESEKSDLCTTILALKEQVSQQEILSRNLMSQAQDANEKSEIQEFQILELEDRCEKFKEEVRQARISSGVKATFCENDGHGAAFVGTQDTLLDNEQLTHLQTKAKEMEEKITNLEKEKVTLMQKEAEFQQDYLRHQLTTKNYEEAQHTICELRDELDRERTVTQVHQYRENINKQTESRYREEINRLERQLSSSTHGRDAERELWDEKTAELKIAHSRLAALEAENDNLHHRLSELENDHLSSDSGYSNSLKDDVTDLKQQVNVLQKKDEASQYRIEELECSRQDLLNKLADLSIVDSDTKALSDLKSEVTELDLVRETLQNKCYDIQNLYEAESEKTKSLEEELHSVKQRNQQFACDQHELTEQIQSMQRHVSELTSDLEKSDDERNELNAQLTEALTEINCLQDNVQSLTTANEKLEKEVESLQNEVDVDLEFDLDISPNTNLLNEKDAKIAELEEQISELTARQGELKEELSTSEGARVEAADHHKQELQEREENWNEIVSQLEEQNEISASELREKEDKWIATVQSLESQLSEARGKEIRARDHFSLVEQENSQRIHSLHQQLSRLEDNESTLTESINQLSDVEQELRLRVEEQSERELHAAETELVLKTRISDLQKKMNGLEKELETKVAAIKEAAGDREKIKELEYLICEMSSKEAGLRDENNELKERLQNLEDEICKNSIAGDDSESKSSIEAQEDLSSEDVVSDRDKQLSEKITAVQQMNTHLEAKLNDIQLSESNLKEDLAQKEASNKELHDKLDILSLENQKLEHEMALVSEQVSEAAKKNKQSINSQIDLHALETEVMHGQVQELEKRLSEMEQQKQNWLDKIDKLERYENHTKPRVEELEISVNELTTDLRCCSEERAALREKLLVYEEAGDEELIKLQEKVDILLDTEENMMDRLQEAENEKERLTNQVNDLVRTVGQLEEDNNHLNKRASLLHHLQREYEELETAAQSSEDCIHQLKESEQRLKQQVNDLEKNEALLKTSLSAMESSVCQKELLESDLREQLHKMSRNEASLTHKVTHLEKREAVHKTRINDLEAHNLDILTAMKSLQENQHRDHVINSVHMSSDGDELVEETIVPVNAKRERTRTRSVSELVKCSQDELVSSVHQYQQMEGFHKAKIADLQLNLTNLRREIEFLAEETMACGDKVHTININSKHQEVVSERRFEEVVRAETELQMKVLSLQRQLIHVRGELAEARTVSQEQSARSRLEVEAMEDQLDDVRKVNARLKNKLQYGTQNGDYQTQSLVKIQHLESLVLDLEASKRKLERQVACLEESEGNLRELLSATEGEDNLSAVKCVRDNVHDVEKHIHLRQQIQSLIASEANLKARISELEAEPVSELQCRIQQLERIETGLRRKVELLEDYGVQRQADDSDMMLDTPETVLKQRIRELEKMERHNKQQIADMERDREELHEIARKDKNLIHELNVRVRELQLAERNQRDQVGRLEVSEGELQTEVDRLTDQVEDLEDELRRLRSAERNNKTKLIKYESVESDLSKQLDAALDEKQKCEQRLKKQLADAENEKSRLVQKLDELTDRLNEQETAELALKQRLRNTESSEMSLQNQVAELELSDTTNKARLVELEAANEGLSQKLNRLDEEKSNLVYGMSELESIKEDAIRDKDRLDLNNRLLREELDKFQGSKTHLLDRVDDAVKQSIELQGKLQNSEKNEYLLKQEVAKLKEEVSKAHAKSEENAAETEHMSAEHERLKAEILLLRAATKSRRQSSGDELDDAKQTITELRKENELLAESCQDLENQLLELEPSREISEPHSMLETSLQTDTENFDLMANDAARYCVGSDELTVHIDTIRENPRHRIDKYNLIISRPDGSENLSGHASESQHVSRNKFIPYMSEMREDSLPSGNLNLTDVEAESSRHNPRVNENGQMNGVESFGILSDPSDLSSLSDEDAEMTSLSRVYSNNDAERTRGNHHYLNQLRDTPVSVMTDSYPHAPSQGIAAPLMEVEHSPQEKYSIANTYNGQVISPVYSPVAMESCSSNMRERFLPQTDHCQMINSEDCIEIPVDIKEKVSHHRFKEKVQEMDESFNVSKHKFYVKEESVSTPAAVRCNSLSSHMHDVHSADVQFQKLNERFHHKNEKLKTVRGDSTRFAREVSPTLQVAVGLDHTHEYPISNAETFSSPTEKDAVAQHSFLTAQTIQPKIEVIGSSNNLDGPSRQSTKTDESVDWSQFGEQLFQENQELLKERKEIHQENMQLQNALHVLENQIDELRLSSPSGCRVLTRSVSIQSVFEELKGSCVDFGCQVKSMEDLEETNNDLLDKLDAVEEQNKELEAELGEVKNINEALELNCENEARAKLEFQRMNDRLASEVNTLLERIELTNSQLANAKEYELVANDLEKQVAQLKDQHIEKEDDLIALEKARGDMEKLHINLHAKIDILEGENRSLAQKIQHMNDRQDKKSDQLKDSLQAQEDLNEQIKIQLRDQVQLNDNLRDQNERLASQISSLESSRKRLQRELSDGAHQDSELRQELEKQITDHKDFTNALENKLKNMEEERNFALSENQKLKTELKKLEELLEEHDSKIKYLEGAELKLQKQLRKVTTNSKSLEDENSELKLRCDGYSEKLHQLNKNKVELESSQDDLLYKVEKTETALQKLQQKLRPLMQAKQVNKQNIEEQQWLISDLQNTIKSYKNLCDEHEVKMESIVQSNDDLMKELASSSDALNEAEYKAQIAEEELMSLSAKLQNAEIKATECLGSMSSLERRLIEMEMAKQNQMEKCNKFQDENDYLRSSLEHTEAEVKHLRDKQSDGMLENQRLQLQLNNLRLELHHAGERKKEPNKTIPVSNHMQTRKGKIYDAMQNMIDENIGLHSKIRELDKQIFELNKKMKSRIETKPETQILQNPGQADNNEESNRLLQAMQSQISELQQDVFRLQCDNTALETENQCLTNELSDTNVHDQHHSCTQTDQNEPASSKLIEELRDEIQRLQMQVVFLAEMEHKVKELENSERQHHSNWQELEDQCRTKDEEISELKLQVIRHSSLIQAHQLLKENHEAVKEDFEKLSNKIKKETVDTANKSSQARLTESFTLRQLTPGFSKAVQVLGTQYPDAYYAFVKSLKPDDSMQYRSRVNQNADGTCSIEETTIIPEHVGNKPRTLPGTAIAKVQPNRDKHLRELVNLLPQESVHADFWPDEDMQHDLNTGLEPVEEAVISPTDKVPASQRPVFRDAATNPEARRVLIDRLVDLLPNSDVNLTEDEYWKIVEDPGNVAKKIAYWQQMESNSGENVDDVTLVFDVRSVTTDDTSSEAGSTFSMNPRQLIVEGSPATPLPTNGEDQDATSSDEADTLMDGDDELVPHRHSKGPGIYKHHENKKMPSIANHINASNGTVLPKTNYQGAPSVESLPDSGMESLREEENIALKKKIADLKNQLEESELRNTSYENLKRALEMKDKQIRQLHLELDTMNEQLKTKDNMDKVHKSNDINANNRELVNAETLTDLVSYDLQEELKIVNKALTHKDEENAHLRMELEKYKTEMREVHNKKIDQDILLGTTQTELASLKGYKNRAITLEADLDNIKKQYADLMETHSQCKDVYDEKSALETIVLKLRGQLRDFEKTDLEKAELSSKLSAAEDDLRLQKISEEQLSKENVEIKKQLDELSNNISQCHSKLADYDQLRAKVNEMESTKAKASDIITPLKDKVMHYEQLCKQKDEEISCLVNKLHQQSPGDQDRALKLFLAETDRECTQGEGEDYLRPLSPQTSHDLENLEIELMSSQSLLQPSSKHPHKSKIPRLVSSSQPHLNDSTQDLVVIDTKYDPSPVASDFVPLSTSELSSSKTSVDTATDETEAIQGQALGTPKLFTCVKDYNPLEFSRSGYPHLELPLKSGDVVNIFGEANDRGYCEGEVDGRKGLVPSLYLVPCKLEDEPTQQQTNDQHHKTNIFPEDILSVHHDLIQANVPQQTYRPLSSEERSRLWSLLPGAKKTSVSEPQVMAKPSQQTPLKYKRGIGRRLPEPPADEVSGAPEPPSGLRVQRAVGQHSVLLCWSPPRLDDNRASNGHVVTGYMITINNKDQLVVGSPQITKALVEKLTLLRDQTFAIQTMSSTGVMSKPQHVVYEGSRPSSSDSVASHGSDQVDGDSLAGDGDVSSVMSSVYSEDGERRVFMAVYDYNPLEHSPNADPSHELCFKAGDIVVTYGSMQADGFYQAKVRRRRGLVPASFIEEVALLRSESKQGGRGSSCVSLQSSLATSHIPSPGNYSSLPTPRKLHRYSLPSKIPTSIK